MAKRQRAVTPAKIEKRLREGRGQGRGADYRPFLHIQDVPSHGLVSRILGVKAKREHHLMSQLETAFFHVAEFAPTVIDIREQFPLMPLDETMALAERLGIRHPVDPKSQQPIMMTTDFVLTLRTGLREMEVARAIKPSGKLQSTRTLEKLALEHSYWEARGIDWGIVTERELPTTLIDNLLWLHPFLDRAQLGHLTDADLHHITNILTETVPGSQQTLKDLALACDDRLGFPEGTALSVARHLLATGFWVVDLARPLRPTEPLVLQAAPALCAVAERKQGNQ